MKNMQDLKLGEKVFVIDTTFSKDPIFTAWVSEVHESFNNGEIKRFYKIVLQKEYLKSKSNNQSVNVKRIYMARIKEELAKQIFDGINVFPFNTEQKVYVRQDPEGLEIRFVEEDSGDIISVKGKPKKIV